MLSIRGGKQVGALLSSRDAWVGAYVRYFEVHVHSFVCRVVNPGRIIVLPFSPPRFRMFTRHCR
jgi:hypothetical protein